MNTDAAKRAKIIDKVRALLSMTTANGCTEAEAMTAASMASKLMEQYDLALGDVASLKDERIAQQSKPFSSTERPHEMHAAGIYVAPAVGEFFDCKIWRNYTEIIFFGLRNDVELAHIMLAMIRFAMDRELSEFMKSDAASTGEHPRSLASSFLRGMGHRISERLRQIKAERTANVRAKGKDLVVIKGAIVDAAFAAQFPNLKPARPSAPPKSEVAYSAGFAAGDRVNLGHKEVAARPGAAVGRKSKRSVSRATVPRPMRPERRFASRPARLLARQTSTFIAYVVKCVGYGGMMTSLWVFNGAMEAWLQTRHSTLYFIDWVIDRQPLWAAYCVASIACSIRIERLGKLQEFESARLSAMRGGHVMGPVSTLSSSLHILNFVLSTIFVYTGNRLAPQIRDNFTSNPDRPLLTQLEVIVKDAGVPWIMLAQYAIGIAVGHILAPYVFALGRAGRH